MGVRGRSSPAATEDIDSCPSATLQPDRRFRRQSRVVTGGHDLLGSFQSRTTFHARRYSLGGRSNRPNLMCSKPCWKPPLAVISNRHSAGATSMHRWPHVVDFGNLYLAWREARWGKADREAAAAPGVCWTLGLLQAWSASRARRGSQVESACRSH